jgi:hypothetical protein
MPDILALLGGSKPKPEEASPSKGGGVAREYAREAFSALRDDDEEGFISAFLGAVKACGKKPMHDEAEEYETDDDEV